MGYRSDVRLVIEKEQLNQIEKYIKENPLEEKNLRYVIEHIKIKRQFGQFIYLGWDNLNINATEEIVNLAYKLNDYKSSYRLSILGENYDDYQEMEFTNDDCISKKLPNLSIIRIFDEQYIEQQIVDYENMLNREKNEIEYE